MDFVVLLLANFCVLSLGMNNDEFPEPAPAPAPEAGPSEPPTVPETDFNPSLVSIIGPNAGEPHPGNQLLVCTGLVNAPQHNGRRCWVLWWMSDRGRYEVILGIDEILNVRPQNLRLAVPTDFRVVPANVFAYVDDDDDDVPLEPNQYRVISYQE